MKKLVKPGFLSKEIFEKIKALDEGSNGGSCPSNLCNCYAACICNTKGYWADDDKDEILF